MTGTVAVTDRDRPESDNYVISVTWREANSDIDYSYTVSMNIANPTMERHESHSQNARRSAVSRASA